MNQLRTEECDNWGHWLTVLDGNRGFNFLPSLRQTILEAVFMRKAQGKGIDFKRTTRNMLSSQAMCFNFFVPLIQDRDFANKLMKSLIGNFRKIEDIQIEYTPPNSIFNDQTKISGVDCDALMIYQNDQNEKTLAAIETKYVEKEFSKCSFRDKVKNPKCPHNTIIKSDFSNCLYKTKKGFHYWDVANKSGLFKMDSIINSHCPFGNRLWQLFTNMTLAYGVAKDQQFSDFRYIVICPKANDKLSDDGKDFNQFRQYLIDADKFQVLYLEDIMDEMRKIASDSQDYKWVYEFIEKHEVIS
jgi:hypothetical protein